MLELNIAWATLSTIVPTHNVQEKATLGTDVCYTAHTDILGRPGLQHIYIRPIKLRSDHFHTFPSGGSKPES